MTPKRGRQEAPPGGERCSRSVWSWLLPGAVVLVALVVRLVCVAQLSAIPEVEDLVQDARAYRDMAHLVLNGQLDDPVLGLMNPLYPYFLALIFALLGESGLAVVAVQAVLDTLTVVLLWRLGSALFSPRTGVLAAAGYALYGFAIFSCGLLLATTLVALLTVGSLWTLLVGHRRSAGGPLVLAGVLFGTAILGAPSLVLVLPAVPTLWLLLLSPAGSRRRLLKEIVLVCVGLAVPLAASTALNLHAGRQLSPFSVNGGINFFIGNGPGADGRFHVPDGVSDTPLELVTSSIAEASRRAGRELSPGHASSYWFRAATTHILAHPGDAAAVLLRKVALFWRGPEIPLSADYAMVREMVPILRWPWLGFGVLAPFGLLGMALILHGPRQGWLVPLFVLALSASIVMFFVADRLRFPAVPLLAVAGARAGVWLVEQLRQRRLAAAGAAGAVLLLLVALANLGAEPVTGHRRAVHHFNLAEAFASRGREDRAEAEYRRALQAEPDHTRSLTNLGNILFERGQLAEAMALYEKALAAEPGYAGNWVSVGNVHYTRGDMAAAERHYRRALELDPGLAEARLNLGHSLFAMGRLNEAREQFLQLSPEEPAAVEARYMLGRVAMQQGRLEEAVREFQTVLAAEPSHGRARLALCVTSASAGLLELAREQCLQASRMGQRVPAEVWRSLGVETRG